MTGQFTTAEEFCFRGKDREYWKRKAQEVLEKAKAEIYKKARELDLEPVDLKVVGSLAMSKWGVRKPMDAATKFLGLDMGPPEVSSKLVNIASKAKDIDEYIREGCATFPEYCEQILKSSCSDVDVLLKVKKRPMTPDEEDTFWLRCAHMIREEYDASAYCECVLSDEVRKLLRKVATKLGMPQVEWDFFCGAT